MPVCLEILLVTCFIWFLKLSLLSKNTPKNLQDSVGFKTSFCNKKSVWDSKTRLLTIIISVLSVLRVNSLETVQFEIVARALLVFMIKSSEFLPLVDIVVSSAKRIVSKLREIVGKSLIYSKKKNWS